MFCIHNKLLPSLVDDYFIQETAVQSINHSFIHSTNK